MKSCWPYFTLATIRRFFVLLLAFPFYLFSSMSFGAIIFQDNFDNNCSGQSCNSSGGWSYPPTGWQGWDPGGPVTLGDVTHYAGEISSPGRNGTGKSLKVWRNSTYWQNYAGVLTTMSPGSYGDFYMRFYVRMPVEYNLNTSIYQKMWRFNYGSRELYININGSGWYRGAARVQALDSPGGDWVTLLDSSQLLSLWDGQWHAWQFRFNLTGKTITLWVDGVQISQVSIPSVPNGAVWNNQIQHFPLGNVSSGGYWQSSWQAFEVDDLVFATTKAETDPVGGPTDTTPPTTTISTTDPSTISTGSLTVIGTSSDNTSVSGCKWRRGSAPDESNGTACTGTTSFSCATSGYSIGTNTLYVGCYDAAGNYGSDSITVNYTDTTPPVVSGGSPSGEQPYGITSVNMTVTTNEAATCKFGASDVAYASLPSTFSTTGGTSHSQAVAVSNGGSYTRYVRCIDGSGNANASSTVISWTVAATEPLANTLLSESFENSNFVARGWYDGSMTSIATSSCYSGNCLQWTWNIGQTQPNSSNTIRYDITDTDELFVRLYIKFDSDWRGSQQAYHPHLLYFPSSLESAYSGLGYNYLQTYLEFVSDVGSPYEIRPSFAIQDSIRVNTSLGTPPNNLTTATETRSVAHCNGCKNGSACGDIQTCYSLGGGQWYSARSFVDTATELSKGVWHKFEMYLKMNSISGNVSQADGILRTWLNDVAVENTTNMIYRTNQDATKKWGYVVLGPYIGDGSPITQTMWIDELTVMDGMPSTGGAIILTAPSNFRILN